jgi:16S rRNA (uracil1498-N3)-methyltransferase
MKEERFFYVPNATDADQLPQEEAVHATRVLRLKEGDNIFLIDGEGGIHQAQVTIATNKQCQYRITDSTSVPQTENRIHIAIAPTKNIERLEWCVEKCVEIGVDEITPLLCRFSERKQLRNDRLEKIILSAAKQSLTPYLPVLHELTPYDAFVREQAKRDQQKFIAHCYKEDKRVLKEEIERGRDVLVLIGPEGDFSEKEVADALALGFVPVSLGNSRLRTETAGVVACHTAVLMNE